MTTELPANKIKRLALAYTVTHCTPASYKRLKNAIFEILKILENDEHLQKLEAVANTYKEGAIYDLMVYLRDQRKKELDDQFKAIIQELADEKLMSLYYDHDSFRGEDESDQWVVDTWSHPSLPDLWSTYKGLDKEKELMGEFKDD